MSLNGSKTYIAAAGLFGLAVYQFSQNDLQHGLETLMAALAAVGIQQRCFQVER